MPQEKKKGNRNTTKARRMSIIFLTAYKILFLVYRLWIL